MDLFALPFEHVDLKFCSSFWKIQKNYNNITVDAKFEIDCEKVDSRPNSNWRIIRKLFYASIVYCSPWPKSMATSELIHSSRISNSNKSQRRVVWTIESLADMHRFVIIIIVNNRLKTILINVMKHHTICNRPHSAPYTKSIRLNWMELKSVPRYFHSVCYRKCTKTINFPKTNKTMIIILRRALDLGINNRNITWYQIESIENMQKMNDKTYWKPNHFKTTIDAKILKCFSFSSGKTTNYYYYLLALDLIGFEEKQISNAFMHASHTIWTKKINVHQSPIICKYRRYSFSFGSWFCSLCAFVKWNGKKFNTRYTTID